MPAVIGGLFITLLAKTGLLVGAVNALSPAGDHVGSNEFVEFRHFQWPPERLDRLADRLAKGQVAEAKRHLMDELSRLALMDEVKFEVAMNLARAMPVPTQSATLEGPAFLEIRDRMERSSTGEFNRLIADGLWPTFGVGDCMGHFTSDGDVVFTNPSLPIEKGDLVAFTACGQLTPVVKIFAGCRAGRAYFYCLKPRVLGSFDLSTITHISPVACLWRQDGTTVNARSFSLEDVIPTLVRDFMHDASEWPANADTMPWIVDGHGVALLSILNEMRKAKAADNEASRGRHVQSS